MAGTMTVTNSRLRFGVIGIDHRHVYHLVQGLLDAGAACAGYVRHGSDPKVQEGMRERFPDLLALENAEMLLEDPQVQVIVCAGIPAQRADVAMAAMRHGKDVLLDKPGVISEEQLQQVRAMCAQSGRIFSICFSERHIVPAVEHALKLVRDGAIGSPIQTLGMGPHRLNATIRPGWFFDQRQFGGILVDIASHQIDQFLVFTDSTDAKVAHSHVGHYGSDQSHRDFENFGEIILQTPTHRGYVRVDWFTPDGLPTWGDGRLFVMGSHGSIEIRKYLDIEGRPGTNHLFLVDRRGTRHIDCSAQPLHFFRQFLHDVDHRSETCMRQEHVFKVCELALMAQSLAMTGKACL